MNTYDLDSYQTYSASDILHEMGRHFKEYRLRLKLTQKEVSDQANVSVSTIHKFENGTIDNLSFSSFVGLLRAVNAVNGLKNILPALPENPFNYRNFEMKQKKQRIRHPKNKEK